MAPTATDLFRLRLEQYLADHPEVRPATLGAKAGKSKDYIRKLLDIPSQSPTLDTAEKIARQMGTTLVDMICPPSGLDVATEMVRLFDQLDARGRARALAAMRADLAEIGRTAE